MTDRVLASDKALFQAHPIAAVAASDLWIAEEAVKAIDVNPTITMAGSWPPTHLAYSSAPKPVAAVTGCRSTPLAAVQPFSPRTRT